MLRETAKKLRVTSQTLDASVMPGESPFSLYRIWQHSLGFQSWIGKQHKRNNVIWTDETKDAMMHTVTFRDRGGSWLVMQPQDLWTFQPPFSWPWTLVWYSRVKREGICSTPKHWSVWWRQENDPKHTKNSRRAQSKSANLHKVMQQTVIADKGGSIYLNLFNHGVLCLFFTHCFCIFGLVCVE